MASRKLKKLEKIEKDLVNKKRNSEKKSMLEKEKNAKKDANKNEKLEKKVLPMLPKLKKFEEWDNEWESGTESKIEQEVYEASKRKKIGFKIQIIIASIVSVVVGLGFFFIYGGVVKSLLIFVFLFVLIVVYLIVMKKMEKYKDIAKMESVFPDFISLMSSNLRAGMTIDQALFVSSRKEFAPLDSQILKLGKDIVTGKEINLALKDMAERINSEEIKKTITLIISGIRAGGNLSVLLEETASNMRERDFVKKRAASNVLMYVIFIFFAVAIGAPALFGLSSVLVEILSSILSDLPTNEVNVGLPFALTSVTISLNFIIYFSVAFIIVSDILASLILGLVSKGAERDGLKYIVPLSAMGIAVFFGSRFVMIKYFSGIFAS